MPEGDTVLQLSQRLQWMVGRTITRCDIRVPRFATVDFTGRQVTRVWPYGKHLFIAVSGEPSGHIIHTHLRMEGVWTVATVGTRWRRPHHTARIILHFTPQHPGGKQIEAVGFSLGFVRILPQGDYPQVIDYLGPDILDPDWDRDEAIRRIEAHPTRPLGEALLDQRNLAGIGNEYRAEIMFLLGMHPCTPVEDSRVPIAEVVDLSRTLIWENRFSPQRVFTGDKRPGHTSYVFGRAGKPCRRCGTAIEKGALGPETQERIIWWCPNCQPR